jgi:glyoxylase-like metal-dependent hydrolase (beta-lactamase superfamily II)
MSTPRLPESVTVIERGWVSSNNIVFRGRESTAVVDTGYCRHREQTVALVARVLEGRPLERIVNTHAHSDHIGGNAALTTAHPGVHITIPQGEEAVVRAWDEEALHLTPMGQECDRFNFHAIYGDGASLRLGDLDWRAIAAPGHDMDALVLWCEKEGVLISADALWEHGFGVLFPALPPHGDVAATFAAQRGTLDTLAALDVRVAIPGHGAPFGDVGAALQRARERLAYFEADPARNLRHTLKVGLAYVLMIEGRLEVEALTARVAGMSMLQDINRAGFGLDPDAFAAYLVAELEKSGVARREGDHLVLARA